MLYRSRSVTPNNALSVTVEWCHISRRSGMRDMQGEMREMHVYQDMVDLLERWSISRRDDPSPAASLQEMHPHPSPSISRLQTMSPSVEIDALCVHRNAFTLSREICPLCTPSTSLFGDGRWRCGIWISRCTLQSKMMKNFFIVGRREMEMRGMGIPGLS